MPGHYTNPSLTYRDAGVDIDAGNALVNRIKPNVKRTFRPEVIGGLGGFGALFRLPAEKYKKPVLVSGTDGVGTKLKLAHMLNHHSTIGIDLVAMCVNDILVLGAEPLFFLDYYATGQLNVDIAECVINGIAEGCKMAGAALIGGETAEMPGMYTGGEYDLAGFAVGVVEEERIIDGSQVKNGDTLIGLASSGPHSNGYSLIRKILEITQASPDTRLGQYTLAQALLMPTRIYVKPILQLLTENTPVHAIAHITGGGLLENIPRVLPAYSDAHIEKSSWIMPPVFAWLQQHANIAAQEMYRTFNCGIGLVLAVETSQATPIIDRLQELGETAFIIGNIQASNDESPKVIIHE